MHWRSSKFDWNDQGIRQEVPAPKHRGTNNYVFLWEEDLSVENFTAEAYDPPSVHDITKYGVLESYFLICLSCSSSCPISPVSACSTSKYPNKLHHILGLEN